MARDNDPTWFDRMGQCPACGKRPAVGRLKDGRNGDLGPRCEQCARASIASAKRARLEGRLP